MSLLLNLLNSLCCFCVLSIILSKLCLFKKSTFLLSTILKCQQTDISIIKTQWKEHWLFSTETSAKSSRTFCKVKLLRVLWKLKIHRLLVSSSYDFPRLFAIKIRKKSYKFQTSICIRITSSLHLRHFAYILKVGRGGDLSKILIRSKPNPSDLFILIKKGGIYVGNSFKIQIIC